MRQESIVDTRLLESFYRAATPAQLSRSTAHIRTALQTSGVDQEGSSIPVSLVPTILVRPELDSIAAEGLLIRRALIDTIEAFVEEHRAGHTDGPLHRFFRPYQRWWDLIATEVRCSDHIQLMRYDTIRQNDGAWRILESNTCCPAGVVHCGLIRGAWLESPLGQATLGAENPVDYLVDDPCSFVKHVIRVAQSCSDTATPNIAICSYRGVYTNELHTIQRLHRLLQGSASGQLLLGDAREIECTGGEQAYLRGTPIDLIYNKLDPLAIDPGEPALAGWLAAARSPKVEFLNSLGAMYLTEAKRSLALLHDETASTDLPSGPAARDAIERHIPWSRCLPGAGTTENARATLTSDALPSLWLNRHKYVLKPDALTRGEGVAIGADLTSDEWLVAIVRGIGNHGIVQELVDIPTRLGYAATNGQFEERQYWGVDLMYYGAEFAGPVSRAHNHMILNVGAGGSESPTIVLRPK